MKSTCRTNRNPFSETKIYIVEIDKSLISAISNNLYVLRDGVIVLSFGCGLASEQNVSVKSMERLSLSKID